MILGVQITNFDVFEDEQLGMLMEDSVSKAGEEARKAVRLRNVNALIGRNNTGKTSFLMAMSFIKRALNHDVAQASTADGRPGFAKLIIDKDRPAEFRLFFKLRNQKGRKSKYIQYELCICATEFGSPYVKSEKVKVSELSGDTIEITDVLNLEDGCGTVCDNNGVASEAKIGDPHLTGLSVYGKIAVLDNLHQLYNEINGWFFCRFSTEPASTYYIDGNAPGGHKHLSSSGSNINNVLEYMEKSDAAYYDRVITEITSRIPQMKKKKTLPANLESSPDKLFLYMLLLRDPEPHTTIFMETPDRDLYHDMVDVLAQDMRDFALEHHYNQIIFTTHNPYIVENMSPKEIWVFRRAYGEIDDANVKISCAGSNPVVSALSQEGVGMGAIWYGGHLDSEEEN